MIYAIVQVGTYMWSIWLDFELFPGNLEFRNFEIYSITELRYQNTCHNEIPRYDEIPR